VARIRFKVGNTETAEAMQSRRAGGAEEVRLTTEGNESKRKESKVVGTRLSRFDSGAAVVVDALGTSKFSNFITTAPGNLPFQPRTGIMKSVLTGR
jgi:hypothetical protein